MDPSSWLDLLLSRAPALQAAGIRSVTADGYAATIDPPAAASPAPLGTAAPAKPAQRERERVPIDPLDDPATYGGASVPGYVLPAEPTDEADR